MPNKTRRGDFFKTNHSDIVNSDIVISSRNDSRNEHQSLLKMSSLCICNEQNQELSERPDQDFSNNEKDDDVITLDKLLTVLSKMENKKHMKTPDSSQALSTLRLGSFLKLQDTITSHQMQKLSKLLASENAMLKEECLKILNQLLSHPKLAEILVKDSGIQDPIMVLARDEDTCVRLNLPANESFCRIQTLVLHVLDKILRTPSFDFMAIHRRLHTQIYPKLISCLHIDSTPWEVKYAACRILQRLAQQKDFAVEIMSECQFFLQQLKFASSQLKGAYADVLKVLFSHPRLIEVECFGTEILLAIKGLLKDRNCDSQRKALSLVASAMSDCQGIEIVAKDAHLVAYIFACLLMSRCRKVRAIACQAASIMTSLHQPNVVCNVMEGIRFCVDPDRKMEESFRRVTSSGVAELRAHLHLWRCFDVVLDFLLNVICREGELDMPNGQMICSLPLNEVIDESQLLCLAHGIQLVVNICVWPVQRRGRRSNGIKTTRADIFHLCHDRSIRKRYSMLNRQLSLEQWDRFGSTIMTLLGFFCQRDLSRVYEISDTHLPDSHSASNHVCFSEELPCRHDSMSFCFDPDVLVMSDNNICNTADWSVRSSPRTPCGSAVTAKDSYSFIFNSSTLLNITPSSIPKENAVYCEKSSDIERCHRISDTLASAAATGVTILKSPVPLSSEVKFTWPELELLKSILHFIFCISLTSCKEIASPFAKEITQSPLDYAKSQKQKLDQSKRWASQKPGLVGSHQHIATHSSSGDIDQMLPRDTESKESLAERWRVQKVLFNKELFASLGQLMQTADMQIKILCSLVLRAAVQPLVEHEETDSEDVAPTLPPVVPK
ncbi:hypothetical protein C0Q70_10555 [Pomacea canaliculata]|uniref:Uncharacterized protein n=2 Tax=Pomacea canaliculata TaxID=400727 RepID=A0A2T7P3I7_POMCA|nr:hypothetical protein C0Q70_10555 [Pomacea canaliculata]